MKNILGKFTIIGFIMLIILSIMSINYTVQAADGGIDWSSADKFIEEGKKSEAGGLEAEDLTEIGASFTSIGTVLTYIGAGVVVAAMAYMGILYMISPPEKQAKLKQQLLGLVIAAAVIFGAYYIWRIVVNLLTDVVG